MQFRQEMGGPGDAVGLAGSGGVLDQILASRTIEKDIPLQLAGDIQLVKAGEDDLFDLLLFVALGDQVTPQDLQPAFPFPHLPPQVGCAVPALPVRWIACRAVVAAIEGQKDGACALQFGHHAHFPTADGKVDQRPAGEA